MNERVRSFLTPKAAAPYLLSLCGIVGWAAIRTYFAVEAQQSAINTQTTAINTQTNAINSLTASVSSLKASQQDGKDDRARMQREIEWLQHRGH